MQNIDCLFNLISDSCRLAAAPDVFPPDKFNAGVLAIQTDSTVFSEMLLALTRLSSYDGGDTGFLNAFFSDWYQRSSDARLEFGFNALRTMKWFTRKNPRYWREAVDVRVLHFCSSPKPWDLSLEKADDLDLLWYQCKTLSESFIDDIGEVCDFTGLMTSESRQCLLEFEGNVSRPFVWSNNALAWLKSWKNLYLNSREWLPISENEPKIPKTLHFVWCGPSPLPSSARKCIDSWQVLKDEGWNMILWDDARLKKFQRIKRPDIDFDRLPVGMKSDVLRLEILYQYGGVYLDCDMLSENPKRLAALCDRYQFFVPFSHCGTIELNNHTLGSTPGHPFLESLLDSINVDIPPQDLPRSTIICTGPGFLTRALSDESLDFTQHRAIVLPVSVFSPLPNTLRGICWSDLKAFSCSETVGIHLWSTSWQSSLSDDESVDRVVEIALAHASVSERSDLVLNIASFL